MNIQTKFFGVWGLCLTLNGCALGPQYTPPTIDVGTQYKEAAGFSDWKPAQALDDQPRGPWWEIYKDATLNRLMVNLEWANQSIQQAQAKYQQALALSQSANAKFFPTLSATVGTVRSGEKNNPGNSVTANSSSNAVSQQFDLGGTISWEVDLWGKVRRNVEGVQANLQASAADLAAMQLSTQSKLADNYFQLRILDEQKRLLERTVVANKRSLKLTQNRYDVGFSARSDVLVAQVQLDRTQAQLMDLEWRRAQFEHAIAILIGKPPSHFTLEPIAFAQTLPVIPVELPAQLLERRPDVAAAIRRVQAANAQIGVAQSAWLPDLSLSASGGFRSNSYTSWLAAPIQYWSLGPKLMLSLLDGGARKATLQHARGAYDEQVASYRQTVLTALGEVEDKLVQWHVLNKEEDVQQRALRFARESLRLIHNQYEEGIIDYLDVATVETNTLATERDALDFLGNRLRTSVALIVALGGGWEAERL